MGLSFVINKNEYVVAGKNNNTTFIIFFPGGGGGKEFCVTSVAHHMFSVISVAPGTVSSTCNVQSDSLTFGWLVCVAVGSPMSVCRSFGRLD